VTTDLSWRRRGQSKFGVKRLTFKNGTWWDVNQVGGAIIDVSVGGHIALVELGAYVYWPTLAIGKKPEVLPQKLQSFPRSPIVKIEVRPQ
jgi:hypothetical protein